MNENYITRYDVMPIPPVESQTRFFDAGVVKIGVEYRLLNEAIAAAHTLQAADGDQAGDTTMVDRGVSIHVYGEIEGEMLEYLRFDCFDEDPHYHYISWRDHANEMIHIDPIAEGDALSWTLERLRLRLPHMLARAGAAEVASRVDQRLVDAILPRVTEAAYRARFDPNEEAILEDALGASQK
ncbi:hypothetical protein MK489_03495 [Myxococcota bacterium]|nr:hypothetical protein [Myxococcota bacterium]